MSQVTRRVTSPLGMPPPGGMVPRCMSEMLVLVRLFTEVCDDAQEWHWMQ